MGMLQRNLLKEFLQTLGVKGFLVQPHVEATGYHQDADTVGFISIILTMKGTSLHLVVVYFDSSNGLDAGPNVGKAKEVPKITAAIKLPWLIVGDFHVPPDECVASAFYSYLGGTLLAAPKVDFTCTSNGTDRLLHFAIASEVIH